MSTEGIDPVRRPTRFTAAQVLGIAVAVAVVAGLAVFFAVRWYLFPPAFDPVSLNSDERQVLAEKLERLESLGGLTARDQTNAPQPEPYSEADADRRISLTERELNALIASDPVLAERIAIDLDEDLASVAMLIPLDPSVPLLGGRTLRINAGLELAYEQGRPVAILKGVSVMGVPLPNAWLGGCR